MRRGRLVFAAILALSAPLAAQTPNSASFVHAGLDLADAKRNIAGERTKIMTLGSLHLSGYSHLKPEMLSLLLDRLERYNPNFITYEGLSGQQCEMLSAYPATYKDTFDTYCWDTKAALKATGLTVDKAEAAIAKTLAEWPATPSPAVRRRLAALFLAANNRPSAQVQWLRLPPSERIRDDAIDDALFAILDRKPKQLNETYEIAVALAVRLGLERVNPVDDHSADGALAGISEDAYGKALTEIWNNPANIAFGKADAARTTAITNPQTLLGYYRFINTPKNVRTFADNDFLRAVKFGGSPNYGRIYVAWWETRNLRIAANIRAVGAMHPGSRTLNIVGGSHKGYYDAYLNMMHDVEVVDIGPYLR